MFIVAISVEFLIDGSSAYRRASLFPKAKYALVQFALRFEDRLCECGYEELAKQFGMSKQRMSAALKELVERGILEAHPKPEGRGRPINLYRLASPVWQLLRSAQWSDMVAGERHWAAMERLLRSVQAESSSELASAELASANQSRRLAIEDRLLLCVLLCHADRYGVVSVLSATDLRRLAGFGSDALKGRLQRLIDCGLIRAYVPGVTSSGLFGKAKSVYYLNLQHPHFASGYPLAGVMVYGAMHSDPSEAELMLQALQDDKKRLDPEVSAQGDLAVDVQARESPQTVVPSMAVSTLLNPGESGRIALALQVRLELYASWLLSRHWSGIEDRVFPRPPELADIIRHDFVEVRQKERAELSRLADALVDYIYTHALALARSVKRWLPRVPEQGRGQRIAYQELDYLILPHAYRRGGDPRLSWFRTVLAFPRTEAEWHGCHTAQVQGSEVGRCRKYEREIDIPLQARYLYGLLTKPARGDDSAPKS